MRLLTLLTVGLFVGTLHAADDKKDDQKAKDKEAIVGEWKLESLDPGVGQPIRFDTLVNERQTFRKNGKVTRTRPDGTEQEDAFELDPDAKVKTIDITAGDVIIPGLYELDGDTLRLCFPSLPSKGGKLTRPKAFKADGEGVVILTWKRVKDEKDEPKKDK
jgi:uncharacterized protein (TIGR03067 family)